MVTIGEALAIAIRHQENGRLQAAEQIYRQILQAEPKQVDAIHLLGVVAHQAGRHDLAVELIGRAIALRGDVAEFHNNLAEVYHTLGRLPEAVACCRRALELAPNLASAHNNLGNVLRDQGKLEEAIASCRRALELQPRSAAAYNNLGLALCEQGQPEAAIACLQRALEIEPDFADALNNLGAAFRDLGRCEDAAASLRRALEIKPDYASALNNLGAVLTDQGKQEEGISFLRRALELRPGAAPVRFNLALPLLLLGRYEEGWKMYESRPTLSHLRDLAAPRWNGKPVEGQSILLYCEQGFGDALQFLRYAPLVRERARAGRMILDCHPELAPLLAQSLRGEMEIAPRRRGDDSAFPKTDWHLPLLSAPLALGILEPLPMAEPYLHANPGLRTIWRERLGPSDVFRVGLAWKGFHRHPQDRARSLALAGLLPLLKLPGVRFHSLQVGADADERAAMAAAGIVDLAPQIKDFADTAAIVAELDLVISVDTAVAHLAGGLGRPVWTLLSFGGEWRWGIAGESTPWYPTMRLFRQPALRDWNSVLQRVAAELSLMDGCRRTTGANPLPR